ncbi:Uncharacterized protein HZ326_24490 [Fusarium oxysporum f. sp. albedinis]|nr:Uncharacterized protein HZ326_24490 [Fusarium oxysporum f. sp. albedinis]
MQPITMLVKSRVGIEPIAAVNKPCKKEQGTPTYTLTLSFYTIGAMIEQLESLGLYLNQPEPAIICIQCKFALKVDGDRVSRHLGERHGISKLARRGLGPFIRTLRLPDPETLPVRSDGSSPHPHLRIQQGAACRHCGLRSISLEVLSRHLKKVHSKAYIGSLYNMLRNPLTC